MTQEIPTGNENTESLAYYRPVQQGAPLGQPYMYQSPQYGGYQHGYPYHGQYMGQHHPYHPYPLHPYYHPYPFHPHHQYHPMYYQQQRQPLVGHQTYGQHL
jgi:spore coat protein T